MCRRVVPAKCPDKWYRNPKTCECTHRSNPSCPDYTKYGGSHKCYGKKDAQCPPYFKLVKGCYCELHLARFCKHQHLDLAEDGCSCKLAKPPSCKGYGCRLNQKRCRCEKRRSPYDSDRRRDPYSNDDDEDDSY